MPDLVSHFIFYMMMLLPTFILTQCLVLFAVYIRYHRGLIPGTKSVLLGQNVFSLTSLKPGEWQSWLYQ